MTLEHRRVLAGIDLQTRESVAAIGRRGSRELRNVAIAPAAIQSMKRFDGLCLALMCWLPGSLNAQDAAVVGARVRISTLVLRANAVRASPGLLLASSSDSLLIGFSGRAAPVALARSDITAIQLSLGGDGWRGAVVGAQIGTVAGAIAFGIHHLNSRLPPPRFSYDNGDLAFAALTGAAWGLAAGALAGAAVAQERWAPAGLPAPGNEALPSFDTRQMLQTEVRLGLFADDGPIRLRTRDGRQFEGRYDGHANGFVRVAGTTSHLVPVSSVVEISERRPVTGSWLRRGALIGAALGVAFVAAAAIGEDCPPDFCVSAWGYSPMFGIYGAVAGGAVGAILGSYVKGWRPQKW